MSTRDARRLISLVFDISKGAWRGSLPKPRVSPSLTLGDCVVKDIRSCSGDNSPEQAIKKGNKISNFKSRTMQMPQGGGGLMGLITWCLSTQAGAGLHKKWQGHLR
jgi:hypothetical protein